MVYEKTQKWARLVAEMSCEWMNTGGGSKQGCFLFFTSNFASTCPFLAYCVWIARPSPSDVARSSKETKIASGSTGLFSLFKQGNGTNAGLLYKKSKWKLPSCVSSLICALLKLCIGGQTSSIRKHERVFFFNLSVMAIFPSPPKWLKLVPWISSTPPKKESVALWCHYSRFTFF